jgi:hypothetical protein
MKKISLLFALVFVMVSCKNDATNKVKEENVTEAAERDAASYDLPEIAFDKTEHDFGTIANGTPVETVFTYTNTGKSPLVVSNIKSSCGCTVPSDWSKDPLAPGESGKFTVKYSGKGQNQITKSITLTTNTEKGSEIVKIKAFVEKKEETAK